MDDNNNSRIVLDKKMDEMLLSFSNFHALISRNDVLSANSSLQKSLSDLQLMLKKVDSAFMGYNSDKVKTDKSEHYDANSESLSGSYLPSSLFPSSPFAHYSSVKLENKTGESVDLNNDLEGVVNKKNGGETSNAQNYKNSSVTELKTLENEILGALKRLEKTKPNLELEKEK
jgi:hypothetical protein